jgi:hypothetical protein
MNGFIRLFAVAALMALVAPLAAQQERAHAQQHAGGAAGHQDSTAARDAGALRDGEGQTIR